MFDVRFEGAGVYSVDIVNGSPAMIKTGTSVRLIISAQTANLWTSFQAPFVLYSPDNSVTQVIHTMNPMYTSEWGPATFPLSAGVYSSFDSWDGMLPDAVIQTGIAFGNGDGWDSPEPVDAIIYSLSFPEGQSGTFCIDTAYFAPAGTWATVPVGPADWGDNGGYAAGGYCITVIDEFPDCYAVAGDANHSGAVTIGDVNEIINRIFRAAPHPVCCREMDADGSGSITIGDALYLVQYIHVFGPAPIGGPAGMECGE
ncbi:hypothetical protein JYT16_00090 [Gemmatimonas aurantiaca]|nr:hypothetical protein [Gemmatimonas aurantiaca]